MVSPSQVSATGAAHAQPVTKVFLTLWPIVAVVFMGFLTIGIQLPVLPLHVSEALGMDSLVVGAVVAAQFAAALCTRVWAGNVADMQGPRRAVLLGLLVVACSGLAYGVSLFVPAHSSGALWLLVLGRVLLGCGESLIVTGALSWAVGLVGPQHAGQVMAWVGIAMYGAYAAGAPLGLALQHDYGFAGIALAAIACPVLAMLPLLQLRAVAAVAQRRTPFYQVLGQVWRAGMGLALCSVGFGVLSAFVALLFAARDWGQASLAFTAFGVAFILARMLLGHVPDKHGGARVALVCVLIEAVGLLCIWSAPTPVLAYVGAALTGLGYSLAFPGFGVEAVRHVAAQSRGVAMGAYVAFLDMSLAITAPALGALVGVWGIGSAFLVAAVLVALSVLVALRLMRLPVSVGAAHA